MVKNRKSQKLTKKTRVILATLSVAVILAGTIAALELTNTIDIFKSDTPSEKVSTAKTTSTAETAQPDFTDGDEREIKEPTTKSEAVVTDTKGTAAATPESQWSKSANGNITVYSPAKNTPIKNGSTISGAATASTVSFRLIDNVSGVVSQGQLQVVNGKFSGTLSFSSTATQGRLDIFNTKADGSEINVVEIPVRIQQ